MHYAFMAARDKRHRLRGQLQNLLDDGGWNQVRLAAELGISQGHLSKLKRGLVPGSKKIADRLGDLNERKPSARREPWLAVVQEAGARSRDARIAIEAIARLVRRTKS